MKKCLCRLTGGLLAVFLLAGCSPRASVSPTGQGQGATVTPVATAAATAFATPTAITQATETAGATKTPALTPLPTATPTPVPTVAQTTNAPTATQKPTPTPTPSPTKTPAWTGSYIFINGTRKTFTLSGGSPKPGDVPAFTFSQSLTLRFAKEAASFNAYTLQFSSDAPLYAYLGCEKGGSAYEELFFLESGATSFKSYIDGYMKGDTGAQLSYLRFENRKKTAATLSLSNVKTEKAAAIEERIYIQNEYLKAGATLLRGGGLDYLAYLKEEVSAVRLGGRVEVGPGYAGKEGAQLITREVNLLNHYDTGRLVQQSYYGTGSPPYEPGTFMGRQWNYNPVMGGDRGNTPSKIIDFKLTATSIYVKCRPMDWGKVNAPTPAYMEAWYTLDGPNLMVSNRFVDFSGYTHPSVNQELPALYVIEPLYDLYYYEGSKPWTGAALTKKTDLPFWDGIWPMFRTQESWWAFTNSEGFGVGLFIPTVTVATGGIYQHDGRISGEPAAANPTSYFAPLRQMALKSYVPLSYEYVICVGSLGEIRASFTQKKSVITNSSLKNYGR